MPEEIRKIGTLEIESSANHSPTTFFFVQKIGITLMVLIVLAAISGLFGPGIFGKRTKLGSFIQVQYNQFARSQATNIIYITLYPASTNNLSENIQLAMNADFFRKVSIKNINPIPTQQAIVNDKIVYTFLTSQIKQGATITLVVEPEQFGHLETEISIVSPHAETVKINQFIYP